MSFLDPARLEYRTWAVNRQAKEPLLHFILRGLEGEGCRILYNSSPARAPFRISFETPEGERIGVVAYAFYANSKPTRNRPQDEHRFQLKYGSKDGELHELWQDRCGLYTTLLLGINPDQGFFVGADPVLHSPTRLFISLEFKQSQVNRILERGWYVWERDRKRGSEEPVEALVGGTQAKLLQYIRFERDALGEDQGHRQLLAERAHEPRPTVHSLTDELDLSAKEVLDLIERANRLKVAVRGSVAEEHLYRHLRSLEGVESCERLPGDGPDLVVRLRDQSDLTVECKNVLREKNRDQLARLDFQRTRSSKSDSCSRYYRPQDFNVVAACLHSVTSRWEFRFARTSSLGPHKTCKGRLSSNVCIDNHWSSDALPVLHAAAAELCR